MSRRTKTQRTRTAFRRVELRARAESIRPGPGWGRGRVLHDRLQRACFAHGVSLTGDEYIRVYAPAYKRLISQSPDPLTNYPESRVRRMALRRVLAGRPLPLP